MELTRSSPLSDESKPILPLGTGHKGAGCSAGVAELRSNPHAIITLLPIATMKAWNGGAYPGLLPRYTG